MPPSLLNSPMQVNFLSVCCQGGSPAENMHVISRTHAEGDFYNSTNISVVYCKYRAFRSLVNGNGKGKDLPCSCGLLNRLYSVSLLDLEQV